MGQADSGRDSAASTQDVAQLRASIEALWQRVEEAGAIMQGLPTRSPSPLETRGASPDGAREYSLAQPRASAATPPQRCAAEGAAPVVRSGAESCSAHSTVVEQAALAAPQVGGPQASPSGVPQFAPFASTEPFANTGSPEGGVGRGQRVAEAHAEPWPASDSSGGGLSRLKSVDEAHAELLGALEKHAALLSPRSQAIAAASSPGDDDLQQPGPAGQVGGTQQPVEADVQSGQGDHSAPGDERSGRRDASEEHRGGTALNSVFTSSSPTPSWQTSGAAQGAEALTQGGAPPGSESAPVSAAPQPATANWQDGFEAQAALVRAAPRNWQDGFAEQAALVNAQGVPAPPDSDSSSPAVDPSRRSSSGGLEDTLTDSVASLRRSRSSSAAEREPALPPSSRRASWSGGDSLPRGRSRSRSPGLPPRPTPSRTPSVSRGSPGASPLSRQGIRRSSGGLRSRSRSHPGTYGTSDAVSRSPWPQHDVASSTVLPSDAAASTRQDNQSTVRDDSSRAHGSIVVANAAIAASLGHGSTPEPPSPEAFTADGRDSDAAANVEWGEQAVCTLPVSSSARGSSPYSSPPGSPTGELSPGEQDGSPSAGLNAAGELSLSADLVLPQVESLAPPQPPSAGLNAAGELSLSADLVVVPQVESLAPPHVRQQAPSPGLSELLLSDSPSNCPSPQSLADGREGNASPAALGHGTAPERMSIDRFASFDGSQHAPESVPVLAASGHPPQSAPVLAVSEQEVQNGASSSPQPQPDSPTLAPFAVVTNAAPAASEPQNGTSAVSLLGFQQADGAHLDSAAALVGSAGMSAIGPETLAEEGANQPVRSLILE